MKTVLLLAQASLVSMIIAGQAAAQTTAPAVSSAPTQISDSEARTDTDIVVTAQKREQRLQDVPVSITVLGGGALDAAKIESGTEIARQTPNLRVSVLGDESQPKFSLRGVSTSEFNLNAISSTGIFYDEVYVGASFLGGAQIYDLERVEVLRGPQGTLYGKNTTAGAVNFISKRPTYQAEAELTAGYGSYDYKEAKGAVEVPLVADRLTARFAFNFAHSDGYIENVNPAGRDLSNIDRASGRLTLAYKDDNGFDATLRLFAVHNDARAIGAINMGTGPGGTNAFGLNPRVNPFTGAPLTRLQVATDRSGVIEVRGKGAYLTLNKDLGGVTLTSISSYLDGRFLNTVDGDGTVADLLHIDFGSKTKEISQDLRVATTGTGPFQLIAGVYYYRDDIDINTVYDLFGGPTGPVGLPILTQSYNQVRRSLAAYVDGTYALNDVITLYAGLRYTDDKGRLRDFRVAPLYGPLPQLNYHDGEPTGRIGARFKVAPDVMVYGQFSRGYRSSAFNGGALLNPADLNVASPEKLDAYEVGLKSQFADRAITFNASAFLYNFQNQQFINVVGIGNSQLVNAGKSRLYGVELETVIRPVERLSFSGGLGLLHTEYRQLLISDPLAATTAPVNFAGNDLIEAPHHTFNFAGDYSLPIGGLGTISLHGDATHVGSQYFSASNRPEFRIGAFWDVGARIAWTDPSKRFELAVYGKNLSDNRTDTGVQIDPATMTRFATVPYPRRYGVELTAKF